MDCGLSAGITCPLVMSCDAVVDSKPLTTMPKPTVYVETSIVSYLTAVGSRDVVLVAHQELTRTWWASRDEFSLFASRFVRDEASADVTDHGLGNSEASALIGANGFLVLLVHAKRNLHCVVRKQRGGGL